LTPKPISSSLPSAALVTSVLWKSSKSCRRPDRWHTDARMDGLHKNTSQTAVTSTAASVHSARTKNTIK